MSDADLPSARLAELLDGKDGWIVGHVRIDHALLALIPSVQVIARRGVGYEKVDLEAAAEFGKVVTVARGGNEETVADHAIGLMLAVGRQIRFSHEAMRNGDWSIRLGTDLYRKTVGLIGLGQIARGVVRRLKGFDNRILVCTPRPDAAYAKAYGITYVDRETLLRESDYISLHAPLTPQTRTMIDEQALGLMKKGAILINTARSALVDEAALVTALRSGKLLGAGLDVLNGETDPAARPLADALLAHPGVVVTPHTGASTLEGLARTNLVAARTVMDVLDGRDPPAECIVADGRRKEHPPSRVASARLS
jgi:D-3-phosphoglycerate dehydrogenase